MMRYLQKHRHESSKEGSDTEITLSRDATILYHEAVVTLRKQQEGEHDDRVHGHERRKVHPESNDTNYPWQDTLRV